ncbi:hypothetical protein [Sphingomonas koreensis]|uniref:hypothetical protein n=1 Tax=Sphingomonas koreensis TaxID=93064 RepID=UPI000B2924AC|nr:hypothetical protein [Sphingomonas koreensis]PJI87232.1 hypothetical protein BDW16_0464 [Sphingomonas koreensis]
MIIRIVLAALAAAAALPTPALATVVEQDGGAGHYEWRAVPQFGPRATGPAQKRVWVPDHARMAKCACGTRDARSTGCMHRGRGAMVTSSSDLAT